MSHDQLFKDLLRTFFYEVLKVFKPEIAEAIDPESITFLDPQTFTDIPAGQLRIADAVAQVRALEGTPELVLIHAEVQADDESEIGHRIWEYNVLLDIRNGKPVISIALLPFATRGGVSLAHYSRMAVGQQTAGVYYGRIAMRGLNAEEYLAGESLVGVALAALMRPPGGDTVELKLEILQRLAASGLDEARLFLLVNFVESYLPLEGMEAVTFQNKLQEEGAAAVKTLELTWADPDATGRNRTRNRPGVAEGKRSLLLDQIRTRFGVVPERLADRIAGADDEMLTRLSYQVVQAQRLDEVTG